MARPISTEQKDRLRVEVYADRQSLGEAAAERVAGQMRSRLLAAADVNIVFAAAPSQIEFLFHLREAPGIDWPRVRAFHLDEYIGLPPNAPQRFAAFLRDHLFDHVPVGEIQYLNPDAASLPAECARYARLLSEHPLDIACLGVGENGHLAFNDPSVADFSDPQAVKAIELEASCRRQQVHDGCFSSLDQVPARALTLTIPAILQARQITCVVPGATKAPAVRALLEGAIAPSCPASILRTHADAVLLLDPAAAGRLASAV